MATLCRRAMVVAAIACGLLVVSCGSKPTAESTLRLTIEQVNRLTPIEVDEITVLDSATYALPATLRYHYTLGIDSLSAAEREDMVAYMRASLPVQLRAEKGAAALNELGVHFVYLYGNPRGEPLFEVEITPEEYAPTVD